MAVAGRVLGTLTVGLLYLMARLLFRRRRVALLFAGILAIDGLLFQQSRIAMNDVYASFFIVAGFTLLAWFLQSDAVGRRRARAPGDPAGVGRAVRACAGVKWVAAYAIGGAI
jgi:dolichyl-phosphate-mannose--protein O-mannosyl transferase